MPEMISPSPAQNPALGGKPAADGLPPLPGFDVDAALKRLGNNVRLYTKLLQQFADNQSQAQDQFQGFLDSGDMEGAKRVAHTLKGLAGSLGATALYAAALHLEEAVGRNDPGLWQAAQDCFGELDAVIAMLRAALAGTQAAPKPQVAQAAVLTGEQRALFAQLKAFVQDNDAAAQEFFDANAQQFGTVLAPADFTRLKQAMAAFDFDAALAALQAAARAHNL